VQFTASPQPDELLDHRMTSFQDWDGRPVRYITWTSMFTPRAGCGKYLGGAGRVTMRMCSALILNSIPVWQRETHLKSFMRCVFMQAVNSRFGTSGTVFIASLSIKVIIMSAQRRRGITIYSTERKMQSNVMRRRGWTETS
jgi:hypothetical protein